MPLTFGASQADDATTSFNTTIFASGTHFLVTGWWNPTNIAGTDVLWSAGDVACAQMVNSTSVKVTADNTTDGVWTGTLTTLNNGEWAFLAFLGTFNNTGPVGDVKMWQGDIYTCPVEVSVVNTVAPVGNFTGSGSFTIGNKGTSATDAYDGDIANVTVMGEPNTNTALPISPAAAGAWAQNEVARIFRNFVKTAWLGDYNKICDTGKLSTTQRSHAWFPLDIGNPYGYGRAVFTTAPEYLLTVTGATKSVTNGNPRPAISTPLMPWRRR